MTGGEKRVVLITGATSGIGLAMAEEFSKKGDKVYGIARREAPLPEGVSFIPADVTDEEQVKAAVSKILSREGRIDVLVNNAGFGISGAVEFTELSDAKRQFEVNFFGMVNMTKAALPAMRERGAGMILNMSSVAAVTPIPYQTYYSASKAAINNYTMALGNEVRPFGIRVSALMPGDVKTGFTAARKKSLDGADIYKKLEKSVRTMEHDEQNGMSPAALAKRAYYISARKRPKPLYSCGFAYCLFCVLAKLLPSRFVNWILSKLYG
ncbi:MAG: SDR family oxidoreductase [Clostridiales bacterium]|nr:SDR family oxidoreductase [Clostridiales bacterium]